MLVEGRRLLLSGFLGLVIGGLEVTRPAAAEGSTWVARQGSVRLVLTPATVDAPLSVAASAHAWKVAADGSALRVLTTDDGTIVALSGTLATNGVAQVLRNHGGAATSLAALTLTLASDGSARVIGSVSTAAWMGRPAWNLTSGRAKADAKGQRLRIDGLEARVAPFCATTLSEPTATDELVGTLSLDLQLEREAQPLAPPALEVVPAIPAPGTNGPDVIVGDIGPVARFGNVGGVSAFAFATESCNIGNEAAAWIRDTPDHPVIGQNLYRLSDGRLEQLGQSWLKHAFFALAESMCSLDCDGVPVGNKLLPKCSDPYSAGLNAGQDTLGPRSEVNPFTGVFKMPHAKVVVVNDLSGRMQVADADLDAVAHAGARYFIECEYVTRDDAAAGNGGNNASHREVRVTGQAPSLELELVPGSETQRMRPAIEAWRGADPAVKVATVDVPGDGRFFVASRATQGSDGWWHYELAVENLNAHRAMGALTVPLAAGTPVRDVGFHDVHAHSGEPWSTKDWDVVTRLDSVNWHCDAESTDPNANALRWGTLYNFWFDARLPPADATAALGLFRSGMPTSVAAAVVAPVSVLALDVHDPNIVMPGQLAGDFIIDVTNTSALPTTASGRWLIENLDGEAIVGASWNDDVMLPPGQRATLRLPRTVLVGWQPGIYSLRAAVSDGAGASSADFAPFVITAGKPGGDFHVLINTGSSGNATAYYKRILPLLGLANSHTIQDLLAWAGYGGLLAADLESLDSTTLGDPKALAAAVRNPAEFASYFAVNALGANEIRASRFFAPKIVDVSTIQQTRAHGWRKVVRLRTRVGSPAQSVGIDAAWILFNYQLKEADRPFTGQVSANTQAMLTRATVPPGTDSAYWLVYGALPAGPLIDHLVASFDAPKLGSTADYFVPEACADCHGGTSAPKLNALDSDHWFDRTKPGDDFEHVAYAGLPVLFDGGADTSKLLFLQAMAVLRTLNEEIEKQALLAGGAKQKNRHWRTAHTWNEVHAVATNPASPFDRWLRPAPPATVSSKWDAASATDAELLPLLNRYCYRCHSSIFWNLFDKPSVVTMAKGGIFEQVLERPAPGKPSEMPQDRDLDDAVRARLIELFAKLAEENQ